MEEEEHALFSNQYRPWHSSLISLTSTGRGVGGWCMPCGGGAGVWRSAAAPPHASHPTRYFSPVTPSTIPTQSLSRPMPPPPLSFAVPSFPAPYAISVP
eukprot:2129380-Rhodomonas_salina.3